MSDWLTIAWWFVPTLTIIGLLKARVQDFARRCSLALTIMLAVSGVLGQIGYLALSPKSMRHIALVVIACALVSYAALQWYRRSQPVGASPEINDVAQAPISMWSWVSSSILIAAFLLVLAASLFNSLVGSVGSTEFFAVQTQARSFSIDPAATRLAYEGGPQSLAYCVAIWNASLGERWSTWAAKIPYVVIWLSAFSFLFTRLRERNFSIEAIAFTGLFALLTPSLFALLARGSDFAWLSACAFGATAAWLPRVRLGYAMLFSVLAFTWNPTLGWPLALSTSVIAICTQQHAQTRQVLLRNAALVTAVVTTMMVLQADIYLPAKVMGHFIPASASPVWAHFSLLSGSAFLLGAGLILFWVFDRSRGDPQARHAIAWLVAFISLSVIASLQTGAVMFGASDRAYDLALTLLLPSGLLCAILSFSQQLWNLSDYAPSTVPPVPQVAPTVEDVASPIDNQDSVPAGTTESTPVVTAEDIARIQQTLMRGFEAFSSGDLTTARANVETVHAIDPDHPDAHHLQSHIYLAENRPGDSLRSIQKAIDVYPEHALFFLTAAQIYNTQSRWDDEVSALSAASKLDPSDVTTKTKLLLARRRQLMAQAAASQRAAPNSGAGGGIEIDVSQKNN